MSVVGAVWGYLLVLLIVFLAAFGIGRVTDGGDHGPDGGGDHPVHHHGASALRFLEW